jgi:tetratricopeptide (TPR) repeat protein
LGVQAAAACVIAVVAVVPVRAQSDVPDRVTVRIAHAQNADLQRRFGRLLVDDGRDLEVDPAAGVDEARQTLLRRASLYEAVGAFAQAEADLTSVVGLSPQAAASYAARGYFYMRRARFGDALADFLLAARLDPSNPRLRFAAGRVQSALGDYPEAIGFYDQAIRLAPREPSFLIARAEARIHLDQPRRAKADYDRAINLHLPRSSDRYYAFLGRGYVALLEADYTEAVADFGSVLEIDPRAVNALLWRGYAREMAGQSALALDDYERAVRVDPTDHWARASLQRLRSN